MQTLCCVFIHSYVDSREGLRYLYSWSFALLAPRQWKMDKINWHQTTRRKHNKARTMCIFPGRNYIVFISRYSVSVLDFCAKRLDWNLHVHWDFRRALIKALGPLANSFQWRRNERHGVSNDRHRDCLLNRLFRCTSKKNSASLAFVRGILLTGGFCSQRARDAENVSIWWRHHGLAL